MPSQQSYIIFYSVCGAIVAVMLFRIWRKNQKPRQTTIATKAMKDPFVKTPDLNATTAARTASEPVSVPPAVTVPVAAPAATLATAPVATLAPVEAPLPIHAASSVTSDMAPSDFSTVKTHDVPSWENRRLLTSVGVVPRDPNLMPRVLPEDVPGIDDSDRVFGSWLNPAFAALLPESEERREEARKDLMSGGFYNPHAVENLAATRYALMMLGVLVFGALLLLVPPQLEPYTIAGCVLAPLLGWAMPALYVRSKAKERKNQIEKAMPDLLDMLNMCVGQGLTVPDSLQRVGRDFRTVFPALSQELSIVNEQAKIGTMQTALENFSRRIDLPEVHSLTALLIQTERMGTSISEALTNYSDTMRESQRQQADEKANRATFRLLFPTVLCLMPAVYLFLLGPAVNELQKFFYGGGAESVSAGSQSISRLAGNRNRGRTANPANRANAAP